MIFICPNCNDPINKLPRLTILYCDPIQDFVCKKGCSLIAYKDDIMSEYYIQCNAIYQINGGINRNFTNILKMTEGKEYNYYSSVMRINSFITFSTQKELNYLLDRLLNLNAFS